MDMLDILSQTCNWERAAHADNNSVKELVQDSGIQLPDDYLEFLRVSNGGEGELPIDPFWFQIWPAETVISRNREYEVGQNAPNFFAFGSNGGGEMLCFKISEGKAERIYALPFIPMDESASVEIAQNFTELTKLFGKTEESSAE